MYGHGRVLPPGGRRLDPAKAMSRLLLVKAARRMRSDGWYAGAFWLSLDTRAGFDQRLYLDEVEAQLLCARRQCVGAARIALIHDDTEGFVGGMA
jgi:hypothetical protein